MSTPREQFEFGVVPSIKSLVIGSVAKRFRTKDKTTYMPG